jgi:hypothetical protein
MYEKHPKVGWEVDTTLSAMVKMRASVVNPGVEFYRRKIAPLTKGGLLAGCGITVRLV